MAETKEYEVLRPHEGDRTYAPGDIRKAIPTDVAHLLGKTLRERKAKAEPATLNKAETAPANKAEPGARLSRKD